MILGSHHHIHQTTSYTAAWTSGTEMDPGEGAADAGVGAAARDGV